LVIAVAIHANIDGFDRNCHIIAPFAKLMFP